jgi:hypothetical protein
LPDDRRLGFAFVHLRILALLDPYPEFQRSIREKGTDDDWRSVTGDLTDFLSRFEMLAGNCSMGLAQRYFGVEPLSLLRFAGAQQQTIINGLDSNFRDFGIDITVRQDGDQNQEWMARDAVGLFSHTGKSIKDVTAEEAIAAEKTKARFLKRKLLEDLADNRKIFVMTGPIELAPFGTTPLYLALRRHGDHPLLCIFPREHVGGTITEVLPGLFHAYIDPRLRPNDWMCVWINAWRAIRSQQIASAQRPLAEFRA